MSAVRGPPPKSTVCRKWPVNIVLPDGSIATDRPRSSCVFPKASAHTAEDDGVGVGVGVRVGPVTVGVRVGVGVGVAAMAVGVRVGVRVGVNVGGTAVGVTVKVGVGVGLDTVPPDLVALKSSSQFALADVRAPICTPTAPLGNSESVTTSLGTPFKSRVRVEPSA